jgi:major outer membrane protein
MKRVATGLALAALLALAAPAAATAGPNDEMKGWMLALEVALTQPSGLDQEYAFLSATPPAVQGSRLILDNDTDLTYRISGGYNFGLDMGSLEVSYWTFDNDDQESKAPGADVFPTLFGYGFYSTNVTYLSGATTRATSSVKASTLDVDYSRALDVGEKFTFRWLAGLRTASFEEERSLDADGSGTYYDYSIRQTRHVDSDAFGVKVGGRGTFGFTEHFGMEGGLAVSLLQADAKGNSFQSITDLSGPVTSSERNRGEDDSALGKIIDVDLRGTWTSGALSVYIGYSASSWEGFVQDPNPPRTSFFPLASGRSRDSVSFNSLNAGIVFRFGSQRLAAP